MFKLVVLSLLIGSPHEQQSRALEAFDREDYGAAAQLLGDLALDSEPHELNRGGLVIAAGNAWRLEFIHSGNRQAVCAGIELMRAYLWEFQETAPEVAARYWALVRERKNNNITCTRERAAVEPSAEVPEPSAMVLEPSAAVPRPSEVSPSPTDTDSPRNTRPLKIAGGVLTASAGVGLGVFTGLAVVYAQRLEAYRLVDGPDEDLYRQGLKIQRWTITTGVTACAALVTGVTLLVSARRRATIQPSIGGLILQGKF